MTMQFAVGFGQLTTLKFVPCQPGHANKKRPVGEIVCPDKVVGCTVYVYVGIIERWVPGSGPRQIERRIQCCIMYLMVQRYGHP